MIGKTWVKRSSTVATKKSTSLILTAVIHQEDDLYVAECPEVGTASQGYTLEEALANLREATELYLEEFPVERISRPLLTVFEAAVGETVYA
jgi:predicted RNase H-like HicB family nuclease